MIAAKIVDTSALFRVIVASFAGGISVTLAFSLAVLGATRFADLRRDGRQAEATAFGVLAGLGIAAVAAAVVTGIYVMTSK